MRFVVSFVCCTRACAWVVSGGEAWRYGGATWPLR